MTVKIPGYKILSTLGKGGMATVYLAEHEIFGRKVALKVMSQGLAEDPSFGERFMREARIVSQLVHPNIVTVYDAGVHEGAYYLSMEFIDGKDLKHVRHQLSLEQKVNIILDIAKALTYAGNKGYVHRDIKPENIMLYTEDSRAVLTDFGIARATEMDKSVTVTGTAIGTPHYMSPEQAKGQPVDIRSDIYGLGVVFYLLLVGYVPYDAESAVAIGIKHITDPVPELPEGLEGLQYIIDKMMAKLPQGRYQNPAELVQDLSSLNLTALVEAAAQAYTQADESLTAGADDATVVSRRAGKADGVSRYPQPRSAARSALADQQPTPILAQEPRPLEAADDNSIWPWLAGLLVLLAVAGGVYYSQYKVEVDDWLGNQREALRVFFPQNNDRSQTPVAADEQPVESSGADTAAAVADELNLTTDLGLESDNVEDLPDASEGLAPLNGLVTEADDRETARIEEVEQRIADLNAQVDTDATSIEALVDAWREMAVLTGEDEVADMAIAELETNEIARIEALMLTGEREAAEARLAELRELFSTTSIELDKLEQFVNDQQQIGEWLREGAEFLARNVLTRPDDDNAVARFESVLALDPQNDEALAGLTSVSARLARLGGNALEEGQTERAESLLTRALAINPANETALRLQEVVAQSAELNAEVEPLLERAESQLTEGNYFEPPEQNAYYYFAEALRLQPNSTTAQRGISRTIEGFENRLLNLIAAGHQDAVRGLMETARAKLPDNQQLRAMELRVDQAIAEKLLAEQPRIEDIRVGGTTDESNDAIASDGILADKTIYVSFDYENFEADATVIQTTLMDGAGSVRIAQVPVVIAGSEGSKTVRIDRSVDRFGAGRYRVEFYLNDEKLATHDFQVK